MISLLPSPTLVRIWVIRYCVILGAILMFSTPVGGWDLSSWYLFLVLVVLFSILPALWGITIAKFGSFAAKSIAILSRLALKSKRGSLLIGIILFSIAAALFMHFYWGHIYLILPRYGLHILAVIYLANFMRLVQPPAAIVLTSSRLGSLTEIVGKALSPYRHIGLLNEKEFSEGIFFSNRTDNFYTFDRFNWQEAVLELLDCLPIVIVDTRLGGKAIEYETRKMLDPKRVGRAIFIVGPNGECPALDANKDLVGDKKLLRVKVQALPKLLRRIIGDHK